MSVSDNSVVLRRFEASPGFFGFGPKLNAGRRYLYLYGFLALLMVSIVLIGVSNFGSHPRGRRASSPIGAMAHRFEHLIPVVLGLVAVGLIGSYLLHNRRKIVISVTGDGLTVSQRPSEVYSFADARLGLWGYNDSTMGTALHLRCGTRDFVLGGRDHRIGAGTRIDEPPAPGVDAWLWAEDFGELLSMAGTRSAVEFRPPVPGTQPDACCSAIRY